MYDFREPIRQGMYRRFPGTRLRRLRSGPAIRHLVAETHLTVADLVWPIFILEGEGRREPIQALPGVFRYSLDQLWPVLEAVHRLGVRACAFFPCLDETLKDSQGLEALNPDNLVCRAVRSARRHVPEMLFIADVALDPYTSHGHDGVLTDGAVDGVVDVDNDATLEILAKQALCLAEAGCDTLAPSDMMDGRIGFLRAQLEQKGFSGVRLLAYSAKYASGFYGPFREAVGSGKVLQGDKRTYQMDPANRAEAMAEIALDIEEGADLVMIKPGLPYLDIIAEAAKRFTVPVLAYQVSGEYAMLRAAAERGFLTYEHALMETLLSFKRAGARAIFTYGAPDVARWLQATESL